MMRFATKLIFVTSVKQIIWMRDFWKRQFDLKIDKDGCEH